MKFLKHFLRVTIGLILLATAVGKLLDVPGFIDVLRDYRALPEILLAPVAYGVIVSEVVLGFWLLWGRFLAYSALASVVMHTAYATWAAVTLLRGLKLENCGCFGVFLVRPLTWQTVVEDMVVVSASAGLMFLAIRSRR